MHTWIVILIGLLVFSGLIFFFMVLHKHRKKYLYIGRRAIHAANSNSIFENANITINEAMKRCERNKDCGGIMINEKTNRLWAKKQFHVNSYINKEKWDDEGKDWHFWIKKKSKIGYSCESNSCVDGAWCNIKDFKCHEKCGSTKTRDGSKIPKKYTYFCNYGSEKPLNPFIKKKPKKYVTQNKNMKDVYYGMKG